MADKLKFIESTEALTRECAQHIVDLRHAHRVTAEVGKVLRERHIVQKKPLSHHTRRWVEEGLVPINGEPARVTGFSLTQGTAYSTGTLALTVFDVDIRVDVRNGGIDLDTIWRGRSTSLQRADALESLLPSLPGMVAQFNDALALLCTASLFCLGGEELKPHQHLHPLSTAFCWYELAGDIYKQGELRRRRVLTE